MTRQIITHKEFHQPELIDMTENHQLKSSQSDLEESLYPVSAYDEKNGDEDRISEIEKKILQQEKITEIFALLLQKMEALSPIIHIFAEIGQPVVEFLTEVKKLKNQIFEAEYAHLRQDSPKWREN